jgi:hypothetical protein
VSTLTATVPLDQHPSADAVERGLAVINRCIPKFVVFVHECDQAELCAEAARLEALPTSPVIRTMRAIVEGELAGRNEVTTDA